MKIFAIGDGLHKHHERAIVDAFRTLGHEAKGFYWYDYFDSKFIGYKQFLRFQYKYILGPQIIKLNHDLIQKTLQFKPDLIFIYRGTHVTPLTIKKIKKLLPNCILIGYNNDDPFSSGHPTWLWRHFMKAIPLYDLVLAYRHHNVEDYHKYGAKRVNFLRSWFIPKFNHPVELTDQEKTQYECDIVFIGHYEPDHRVALLEAIVQKGWKLKLFGPKYWNPVLKQSKILKNFYPLHQVWEEDYNRALSGAHIALCFLSKLNRDTYTRRCFEIPATQTLLLSEYTSDLASLFSEGKEADFFRNQDELLTKIKHYLTNDQDRKNVAKAGYQRVYQDGHDVVSRMRQVLVWVQKIKDNKIS